MSGRELARVEVLGRVKAGSLAVMEAATLMGVSYRQAKRLWRRIKRGGAKALRHRQVGQASNRGTSTKTRQRVLALIRQKYSGDVATRFGPTLVAEHLASEDGLTVDHETLRRWMLAAGLWSRQRKRTPYRQRRERKAHFGELVQLDGSFHAWYEARGARALLDHDGGRCHQSECRAVQRRGNHLGGRGGLRPLDRAARGAARALHGLEECVCPRRDGGGAGGGRGAADAIRADVRRAADSNHSGELARKPKAGSSAITARIRTGW